MRTIATPLRATWLTAALAIGLVSSGCSDRSDLVEIRGSTMGTTYSIKLVDLPPGLAPDELKAQIDARLETVNALMSTYRPDSELSRFNSSRSTGWFGADSQLVALVERAESISAMSDGALDVTVGPLVNLWGFGPDIQAFQVPDEQTIGDARERVGYEKLELRSDPPALRKDHPELYVDLSAIAKGYGVDRIAELLDEVGVTAYLAEIGGELRAKGRKPGDKPWQIAIEQPRAETRAVYRVLTLEDAAMATSGDYRNFHEQDGLIYSHTIDPKTGRPVAHRLASVTVISEDCATADGLATALLVLGPDQGFELAEAEGVAAFFVSRSDGDFTHRATSAFDALAQETDPGEP
jgi:FAD:protein FMN transferase